MSEMIITTAFKTRQASSRIIFISEDNGYESPVWMGTCSRAYG